jgi:hypothetical protein
MAVMVVVTPGVMAASVLDNDNSGLGRRAEKLS